MESQCNILWVRILSQLLWSGGFSPQLSPVPWASLWSSVSAALEHHCSPLRVSNLLRVSSWRVYRELLFLGWWGVYTDLSVFHWHLYCAQQNISVGSGVGAFFAELSVSGRTPTSSSVAHSITPKRRQKWEQTLRVYPQEQTTQATRRGAVI